MAIGINTSHDWTIQAEDGTPQSLTLVGVTGDPSFGDELPDQREQTDVMSRGLQLGRTFGDEQAIEVSWSAQDSQEVRDFVDLVLFRGAYAAGGATPTVTTDPIGGKSTRLKAICTPPLGAPRTVVYARAYWKCSLSPATPTSTWTISATCYARTVT